MMIKKCLKGSFYVEIMVAMMMVGVIATAFLPLLPTLLERTRTMTIYSRLASLSDYIGSYIFRRVNYDRSSKVIPLSFYADGDHLEISGEQRINRLLWASSPYLADEYITDEYKVSILFQDTQSRSISTGVVVTVWYDSNLDSVLNNDELYLRYSTIITEKEP